MDRKLQDTHATLAFGHRARGGELQGGCEQKGNGGSGRHALPAGELEAASSSQRAEGSGRSVPCREEHMTSMQRSGGGRRRRAAGNGGTRERSGAEQLVFARHCPTRCTPRNKYPACDAEIPSAPDGFYSVLAFAASAGDAPRAKLAIFSARTTFSASVGDALRASPMRTLYIQTTWYGRVVTLNTVLY